MGTVDELHRRALPEAEFRDGLSAAGFEHVDIQPTSTIHRTDLESMANQLDLALIPPEHQRVIDHRRSSTRRDERIHPGDEPNGQAPRSIRESPATVSRRASRQT